MSKDGEVVTGLDITGGVTITGDNVTLKDSKIEKVTSYASILVQGSGVKIENVEIDGGNQSPSVIGVMGAGYTLNAVNIHGTGDAVDAGDNVTVENSWIHNLWVASGDHSDGIQTAGGKNLVIEHDTVNADGAGVNSALILGADLAALSNTVVKDCLLDGGNYTIYAGTGGYDSGTISITDNRLGTGAKYGPVSFKPSSGRTIDFDGNVSDATGQAL